MTLTPPKYARIERERRFPVEDFLIATAAQVRHIADRYIDGTLLRLREQTGRGGQTVYKLTKKTPMRAGAAQQGFIKTIYLSADEFCTLAQLPAKQLSKTRYSLPPFSMDIFEGGLSGLRLAEAEFDSSSSSAADALILPSFIRQEVTDDIRFTGGRLVCASPESIRNCLAEYGIEL